MPTQPFHVYSSGGNLSAATASLRSFAQATRLRISNYHRKLYGPLTKLGGGFGSDAGRTSHYK